MNGYENAPATRMLATRCLLCGRPLVDAISVQMGIGPCCREGFNVGIEPDVQKIANKYVSMASKEVGRGRVGKVLEYAEMIRALGLDVVADKIKNRFKPSITKAERDSDIVIEERDGGYRVVTPFRRGAKAEFIDAWRNIPGRRWRDGANWIPWASKNELWALLRKFFGSKYGRGPKGVFRVPPAEFEPKQGELELELEKGVAA